MMLIKKRQEENSEKSATAWNAINTAMYNKVKAYKKKKKENDSLWLLACCVLIEPSQASSEEPPVNFQGEFLLTTHKLQHAKKINNCFAVATEKIAWCA